MHMTLLKKSPISSVAISDVDGDGFIMAVVEIIYF